MSQDWPRVFVKIKGALMRRGRTEHDAEDLVQDAWLRLANYQQGQEVKEPEAFLMRVALNLSVDQYRAHLVQGETVATDEVVLVDRSPTAEDALLARERAERLSICLERLTEKTRVIFLAYRLEDMTYKQIADRHGLSISAVEKHVAKAAMQLGTWMEGW